MSSSTLIERRFRVALSFSGEKREYVAQVADVLARHFSKDEILYDKFHEAEFARRDLGIYLPDLYHHAADLIVLVLSSGYRGRDWCEMEWAAIHSLLKKRRDDEVMLCRFEQATVPGLYETAGYVQLDEKTPEEAAALIVERFNANRSENSPRTKAVTKRVATVPNNLPRLQPFFGRETELSSIADALDPRARTWGALLDGPGGIGKTSLAIRAALDVGPDQFDRIVFLSVKERELDDDGERKLTGFVMPGYVEILNELARELGSTHITQEPPNERSRLLLDALQSARSLLILDNLESLTKDDRDQLFTFVKRLPQGCKAILTSRRKMGTSADILILDKLDEKSALALLSDIAQHNTLLSKASDDDRRVLYAVTNGNPLLLRWVVGQLGRGSCRTLDDALGFLRSCPPGNDPLEFIFGDLLDEFTPDETKVLAALTYFSRHVEVRYVAELAGLSSDRAESALRSLANRALVIPDDAEQNFAIVPMVPDFIRKKRPTVMSKSGHRLVHRAYALVVENGFSRHDRFPVLEASWPVVSAALPLFVAGPNEVLQRVCHALTDFLHFNGRWDEWLLLSQQAERRAELASDFFEAGWRAFHAGFVHVLRKEPDEILLCADRAAAHWDRADAGACEKATARQLRGHSYSAVGDHEAATDAYREAVDLLRHSSIGGETMAGALNHLAGAEMFRGKYDDAMRHYEEALAVASACGASASVAIYTGNLGLIALHQTDWPRAEKFARQALYLLEKVGRQASIAANCDRLAFALLRQGRSVEGLQFARRAVQIYTSLGSPELTRALRTLAECEADAT